MIILFNGSVTFKLCKTFHLVCFEVMANLFFMNKMQNRIIAVTPEEKAIRQSWGRRWGAFSDIEGRYGFVLILSGVFSGYFKAAYCAEAPAGVSEDYIGFVKFKDRPTLIVTAHKITRRDLLNKGWYYIPKYDGIVTEMIFSGKQIYNA